MWWLVLQEDILRVVVDLPQQPRAPLHTPIAPPATAGSPAAAGAAAEGGGAAGRSSSTTSSSSSSSDVGGWQVLVHASKEVPKPSYLGIQLELRGKGINLPSGESPK
jgi:hypothetical protein